MFEFQAFALVYGEKADAVGVGRLYRHPEYFCVPIFEKVLNDGSTVGAELVQLVHEAIDVCRLSVRLSVDGEEDDELFRHVRQRHGE